MTVPDTRYPEASPPPLKLSNLGSTQTPHVGLPRNRQTEPGPLQLRLELSGVLHLRVVHDSNP